MIELLVGAAGVGLIVWGLTIVLTLRKRDKDCGCGH